MEWARPSVALMDAMTQVEKYLNFMIYLVRADGIVNTEEQEHLLTLIVDGMGLEPKLVDRYKSALSAVGTLEVTDEQLAAVVSGLNPGSVAHLIRDAYSLAESDGEIHESELALIRRCLAAAGIPVTRFDDIDTWAHHSLELSKIGTQLFVPDTLQQKRV